MSNPQTRLKLEDVTVKTELKTAGDGPTAPHSSVNTPSWNGPINCNMINGSWLSMSTGKLDKT